MMRTKKIRIAVVLIAALAVVLVSLSVVPADSVQNSPTDNTGDWYWRLSGAYSDGGTAAGGRDGQVHQYYGYGLAIPAGATIDGIEVRLDARRRSGRYTGSIDVELSSDGGASWTSNGYSTGALGGTEATYNLGGATDKWGRTWTPAEINDSLNFRVRVTATAASTGGAMTPFVRLDWIPITTHYTCEPDLVITDKSETLSDGTFTVTYTIKNEGCGTAGASDTTITIDGVDALEDPVPALASGESYSNTVGPFDCPCGETLTIKVCADNDNAVAESNETNNCLENTWVCPELPDLIITDKREIWDGNNFTVSYKVKNQGCGLANASNATLYVDGFDVEHQPTPALGSGRSTAELTFDYVVSCPCDETRNITVCADNDKVVEESDETNNCVKQDVAPKPDLIIVDKHENWIDTNTFTVSYKVKNQGPCPTDATSIATLYVNGIAEKNQATPVLGPGESTGELTFDYVVNCPSGEIVNITVCADNGGVIVESDETNNCEVNFVDRDLVITDIWTVDSKIYYKIENKGSAKAPRSYSSLYVDGELKRIDSVNELAPGKSSIESFWDYSWVCTSPRDTIEVRADYDKRINESNEDNNKKIETWTCPAPTPTPTPTCPDLVITDVWHVGSKIYYEIKNIGGAAAPVSYSRLYIDGRSKRSDNVKALEPGESSIESFSYRWSCTSTADTIKVCADHTKRIAECKEYNNCRTETWYCPTPTPPPTPPPTPTPTPTITPTPTPTPTPPPPTPTPPTTCPDLVISDIWNEGSTIYYKIENIGGAAAPVSYSRLYIDGRSKRSDNVKTLEPGESSTESLSYRWRCTSTTDTIKVCADHTKRIAECDETNNCRTETWHC